MKIIIPKWQGAADYVFMADASGTITLVVYRDDSFLRKGEAD